jgi:archaeosine synthase
LSKEDSVTEKPIIRDAGSAFYPQTNDDVSIPPSLIYPPSLPKNIHDYAAKWNREHSGDVCVVLHKAIDNISDDATIYALANSQVLYSNPRMFVDAVLSLRKRIGYTKLIYTPGLGEPSHLALLAYCSVDLFDSVPLIWKASQTKLLNCDGEYSIDPGQKFETPCSCPACHKATNFSFDIILNHNYYAAYSELKNVRNVIRGGMLRKLVESRASMPHAVAILTLIDREHYVFQEERYPVLGGKIFATSSFLYRPDIVRFRERIEERYAKPPSSRVLLLLPCSAKKPYSSSKSHRLFRRAMSSCGNLPIVHEVIVTSPLAIVPREIERVYPAAHYDISVTGHWTLEEQLLVNNALQSFLKNNEYDVIISHLPNNMAEFLEIEAISTGSRPPVTSSESIQQLSDTIRDATASYPRIDLSQRLLENFICVLSYQFGKQAAYMLAKDCVIKGRPPFYKLFYRDYQLGMITPERGLVSLTLQGATRLAELHTYWVEIDDFFPHGSVFAVGVKDADEGIRIGDEVVVVSDGDVRAVGTALMNSAEMIESNRGEAIKIRHYKRKK